MGKETIQSITDTLAGVAKYFHKDTSASSVSLVGTSAAGYMAVNALEQLRDQEIKTTKLVLLSPAAYPKAIEKIPYGEAFTKLIRKPWNIAESPIFPKLERYVRDGGSLFISFFEADNPPIPLHIQEYYKSFVQRLSEEGGDITFTIIQGVAYNFRRIDSQGSKNIVDNDSIRSTADAMVGFLTKAKDE